MLFRQISGGMGVELAEAPTEFKMLLHRKDLVLKKNDQIPHSRVADVVIFRFLGGFYRSKPQISAQISGISFRTSIVS